MPSSRSLFRSSAVLSGLVTEQQLEEASALVLRDEGSANKKGGTKSLALVRDEHVAAKLVALDWITQYQADQLLNGRTRFNLGTYIITDFIGRGGMGDVFKAEHNLMGREVAVKVLTRQRSTPEAEANFQREIRLQAKLDHPNLVRAYDAGHDGNVYYLVVEYVPGTDLRRLVRTQGKLEMEQAATVIMQAAQGLHHAHSCGLIHRDVKPGNLLVTPQGHTKVSDLGLAGFMDEGKEDPRAGKIVGTADYISPEVFQSPDSVTPLSDIYSLGCTLYYAVTGKVPYPGGSTREKLERHCHDTPFHPQRFNESVSEEFVEVIADMMEKEPSKRVQTAEEIANRLAVWAGVEGPTPQRLREFAWAPPPLPADGDHDQETADLVADIFEGPKEALQGTSPIAGQDTALSESFSRNSGMVSSHRRAASPWAYVMLTAGIAIPLAMCFGAVLMYVFLRVLSGS